MTVDVEGDDRSWAAQRIALEAYDEAARQDPAAREEFAWLRQLAGIFDAVDGSVGSVERALDQIFDAVALRTDLEENWYDDLEEPVRWLCDHLGRAREELATPFNEVISAVFSSWVEPDASPRRYAVRSIAGALTGTAPTVLPEVRARAGRLLRPTRPRLNEALAAVQGADPQGALETLIARGLFDASWLDTTQRVFTSLSRKHRVLDPARAVLKKELFALLASDVENVLRAEALAHELLHRLGAFGLPRASWRVAWLRGPSRHTGDVWTPFYRPAGGFEHLVNVATLGVRRGSPGVLTALEQSPRFAVSASAPIGALAERVAQRGSDIHLALAARTDLPASDRQIVARLWTAAEGWAALCEADVHMSPREVFRNDWFVMPPGVALRELASPLDALLALWDTGYAVYAIEPERGLVALVAP